MIASGLSEKEIRALVHSHVRSQGPGFLSVNEVGIREGKHRIDVLGVSDILHGYEIKSDRDNLDLFGPQIEAYRQVFDSVTVITGEKYGNHVDYRMPFWFGFGIATESGLRMVRQPQSNPCIWPRALAELLWRDDAVQALRSKGFKTTAFRGYARERLWDLVCMYLTTDEIRTRVRECIRRRVSGDQSSWIQPGHTLNSEP